VNKPALFILCFMFFTSFSSYAQKGEGEPLKGHIGITFSAFGGNEVVRFHDLLGAPGYYGDKFFTFGINYLYKLK
jgi:hypothetical protein